MRPHHAPPAQAQAHAPVAAMAAQPEAAREIAQLGRSRKCCRVVRWLPNMRLLAVGGDDGNIHFFAGVFEARRLRLRMSSDRVVGVEEADDGVVMTAGGDALRAWDVRGRRLLAEMRLPEGHKCAVLCTLGASRFVTCSAWGDVLLYSWHTGRFELLKHVKHAHDGRIYSAHVGEDLVATAGADRTVALWSRDGLRRVSVLQHYDAVHAVAVGRRYIATGSGGVVRLYRKAGWYPHAHTIPVRCGVVWALRFVEDKTLMACGGDNALHFIDTETNEEPRRVASRASVVQDATFVPGGPVAVAGAGAHANAYLLLPPELTVLTRRAVEPPRRPCGKDFKPSSRDPRVKRRPPPRFVPMVDNCVERPRSTTGNVRVNAPPKRDVPERRYRSRFGDRIGCKQTEHAEDAKVRDTTDSEATGVKQDTEVGDTTSQDTAVPKPNLAEVNDDQKSRGKGTENCVQIWDSWATSTKLVARAGGVRRRDEAEKSDVYEKGIERRPKVARTMQVSLNVDGENKQNPVNKEESEMVRSPTTITSYPFFDKLGDGKYEVQLKTMRACEQKGVAVSALMKMEPAEVADSLTAFLLRYDTKLLFQFKSLSRCILGYLDEEVLTIEDLVGREAVKASIIISGIEQAAREDPAVREGMVVGKLNGFFDKMAG